MIVDDEIIVREFLKGVVQWERHGYELVGSAADGYQAIEMANEKDPDIIIVDIVMPELDGLEFISKIKDIKPLCKFIILSCMNDISYYKRAIQLGVSEFVLKSVADKDEIIRVVDEVADTIRKERVFDADENKVEKYINKYVVFAEFINMVLRKKIQQTDLIEGKFESYGVNLSAKKFFVLILLVSLPGGEKFVLNGSIEYHIINMCQEIINNCGGGFAFLNYEGKITLLVSDVGNGGYTNFPNDLTYRIRETLRQLFDLVASIGISRPLEGVGDLADGYMHANEALKQMFYLGEGQNYFYSNGIAENSPLFLERTETKRIFHMQTLPDKEVLVKYVNKITAFLREEKSYEPESVKKLFLDILYHINSLINKEKTKYMLEYDSRLNPLDIVNTAQSIEELNKDAIEFIDESIDSLHRAINLREMDAIVKIKKYVEENINSKISLESISKHVYLNTSYISRLFKKETGQRLFDYITKKKLDKSRELLLTRSLGETARELGFSSESYFIRVFKRHFQLTPTQYKKSRNHNILKS